MPFFRFNPSQLRGDFFGGVTAGVVALPLGLAFGAASGVGPMAGVWGALIAGLFASIFGGTKAQISGPTGPMIVVFAGIYGMFSETPELVFTAVVLAGLMQIGFGILRLGQYIRLVPYPVISGFLSGMGCIIIILQLGQLMGSAATSNGIFSSIQSIPGAFLGANSAAVFVAAISLGVVFFWPPKFGKFVPGALVALVVGTLMSIVVPGAPTLGEIPTSFPVLVFPALTIENSRVVLEAALVMALLGAIESLLSSLVAENMTRERHNSNQELIGQGIGNSIAGFFGVLPAAGATMRTVVNIRSGGETKLSGVVHSFVLLAIIVVFAPLAEKIPYAVLAAILTKVGFDIIDFSYLRRAVRGPRGDFALMLGVFLLTVFVDLITAVGVGVVFAALGFVKQTADEQLDSMSVGRTINTNSEEQEILTRCSGRIILFEFDGPLSFGAAADLGHKARETISASVGYIILDFTRISFVDVSATRAVETIAEDAKRAGKLVYIAGMNDKVRRALSGLDANHSLASDTFFDDRLEALKLADFAIQMESEINDPNNGIKIQDKIPTPQPSS